MIMQNPWYTDREVNAMLEKIKYFFGTIGWVVLAILLILGLAYVLFPDLIQNVFQFKF